MGFYWLSDYVADIVLHILADTDNQSDVYISLDFTWIQQNVYLKSTSLVYFWSVFYENNTIRVNQNYRQINSDADIESVANKADSWLSSDNRCNTIKNVITNDLMRDATAKYLLQFTRPLWDGGKINGQLRRTKVSFGRTMMQALELWRLEKRHASRQSDVEQWRNQACNYSHYQVMLVGRH